MIVGISGLRNSGKTSVAQALALHGYVEMSFASKLKEVCSVLFNWPMSRLESNLPEDKVWKETVDEFASSMFDNAYPLSPRFALQYIGTDLFRNNFHQNFWIGILKMNILRQDHTKIVISDVRFDNEAHMIRQMGGKIVKLTHQFANPTMISYADVREHAYASHESEQGISADYVDVYFDARDDINRLIEQL